MEDAPTTASKKHPEWPKQGEHRFGRWHTKDKNTVYRVCIHPDCPKVEYKKV